MPVMEFKRVRWLCAAGLALMAAAHASAQTARTIQVRVTQPVAPRGGVLMLPLTAERHGNRWPETLDLKSQDGRTLTGLVAWIHPATIRHGRQWTDDPRWLLIRAIQPDDDSATFAGDPVMGPYLLAEIPNDMDGTLRLGKQTLHPVWRNLKLLTPLPGEAASPAAIDSTSAFATRTDASVLAITPAPDRPDPVSPFEYWRWTLLADRLEMKPERPFGGEIERMAAEHFAALWRIGMERLARLSPRVAQQCRNMLTQTCIDRRQPFAAWVADPAQVAGLLAALLDFNRNDAQVLSEAVAWIDQQPPLIFWPESEFGDHIVLAMATIRTEPIVTTFTWLNTNEPPQAVRIEPGVLMQVTIDRPPMPQAPAIGLPAPPEPVVQTLSIVAGESRFEMAFGPRILRTTPPGVLFPPLTPPLTLAEIQMRQQQPFPIDQATFANVRRLSGRWEVFFECRRTRIDGADGGTALPETLTSLDDARGAEAITLLLGPENQDRVAETHGPDSPMRVWLTIPETGFWRLARGESDGTLQIHRASYADRWYCRIVLPENWFSAAETSPAWIGFIRSHGDSHQLETGPASSVPWRTVPGRAAINLDSWDDVRDFAGQ
jgi:hypothetical protein